MRWGRTAFLLAPAATVAALAACTALAPSRDDGDGGALGGGRLPAGYRDWRLVSVAREEGDLDDVRAILGNDRAIEAYREQRRLFPEGAIIARIAWSYEASEENNKAFGRAQSFVAGEPKNGVQFMIKDSTRYASTGGWGYFQFDDGVPVAVMQQTCFACHEAVKDRDFLFTRYSR